MTMSKIIDIGNLGHDPEMRYTPNGQGGDQLQCGQQRVEEIQHPTTPGLWCHNIYLILKTV